VISQIVDGSRQVFSRAGRFGTRLSLRVRYSSSGTVVTPPVFKVFGRYKSLEDTAAEWQTLVNASEQQSVTIAPAATTDLYLVGGDRVTTVIPSKHVFDTQGCNEFLIGVETKIVFTGGSPTTAALEVKIT
jgi:hypothetical protein